MRYAWSRLSRQQKGTYGEYVAKMEFVMYGYLVFSAESMIEASTLSSETMPEDISMSR